MIKWLWLRCLQLDARANGSFGSRAAVPSKSPLRQVHPRKQPWLAARRDFGLGPKPAVRLVATIFGPVPLLMNWADVVLLVAGA
jgi:hypothetical protein